MNIKQNNKVKVIWNPLYYTEKKYVGMEGVVVLKRGVYSQVKLNNNEVLWFEDVELKMMKNE